MGPTGATGIQGPTGPHGKKGEPAKERYVEAKEEEPKFFGTIRK